MVFRVDWGHYGKPRNWINFLSLQFIVCFPKSKWHHLPTKSLALLEIKTNMLWTWICENSYPLPETNIAPENQWFEDEIPLGPGLFSGAILVSGSVYRFYPTQKIASQPPFWSHISKRRLWMFARRFTFQIRKQVRFLPLGCRLIGGAGPLGDLMNRPAC